MSRRPASRGKGGWTVWVLLAVALHAVFALLPRSERRAPLTPTPLDNTAVSAEAEAEVEVRVEASEPERALTPADLGRAIGLPRTPRARGERAVFPPPPTTRPATEIGETLAPMPAPEAALAEASERAPLSPAQLGIGAENPFVAREERRRADRRELGRQRFEQAMAADIARADQAVGLGPEGPVLTQLEVAARGSNPTPNSQALFECVTDASGKLLSVELLESSSDPMPWRRVARKAHKALGSTRLRVPKSGYGAAFRVRVVSRVQLPSGADPGLAVNVLGIPVKRGRGPRSTRIDVLNLRPEVSEEKVPLPSGQTLRVPTLKMGSVLSLIGDPADIGAPEQRIVRAHLVSLTVTARSTEKSQ